MTAILDVYVEVDVLIEDGSMGRAAVPTRHRPD